MRNEIYEQVGLAPPRGILLAGPIGHWQDCHGGARVSGEKQIPLIASMVRNSIRSGWENPRGRCAKFQKSEKSGPCILFFDTIDAGRAQVRSGSIRPATSISGFSASSCARSDNLRDVKGVVLLAASNRPEKIDPALLRSGRFDYILQFAKPNAADRAAIMRLCCRRVPLAAAVDFEDFAEPDRRPHRR